MHMSSVTVEVRDKTLTRLGMVRREDLDLELSDLHNNVGSWRLRLGVEHPLAGALRQPGAGIVVTAHNGDEVFSGPVVKQENAVTADDPGGTITFEGVSDTILLADFVALPDPSNPDLDTQTKSHDIRTGPAETLMHAFVNANIGPAAPAARRPAGLLVSKLVMGADHGRGASITKSARFKVLGNLLSELAGPDNLGFRVIQRGDTLRFETYQVTDRSAEVRLDVYNNTLAGHRVAISPPGATRVLVAGQGDLTDRQFFEMETPESLAAEAEWGRRIERFVDQRNTNDEAELQRAGKEVLDEEGFATLAVQAVPMEDSGSVVAMEYGHDWSLGDRVGVVVEGQELASTVTGYVLKFNQDGYRLGALIGDPTGFDPSAALSKRVGSAENRISELERNAENNAAGVKYLDVANFNEATPPENYPQGESLIYVSWASDQGWGSLGGVASGAIRSVHVDGQGRVTQTFQSQTGFGNEPQLWTRAGIKDFGWTAWRKLATTVDLPVIPPAPPPLPDPISTRNNGVTAITATAWADHPANTTLTLTLERDAIVQVELNAWLSISYAGAEPSSSIRFGVNHNGTTPENAFGAAWGQVLYEGTQGTTPGGGQHGMSATVRLDAGTHTFRVQAYKTGTGAASANYWMLRVTPVRWAD
jgi:hypothetical protein